MMNLVGGDFNNQAAAAAAAAASSASAAAAAAAACAASTAAVALSVQPTLLATNTNDIYNLAQMGGLHHQLLQQSAAAVFQNYANMEDTIGGTSGTATANFNHALNGGILVNSNGKPITTSQFLSSGNNAGQHSQQQHQQHQHQMFDHMDDGGACADDSSDLTPKQEIINIDDFVMMTDSNSYDDDADFIDSNDKSTSGGIDITQPHGVHDTDLLMSMSGKHKMLSDAVAAAAAANRNLLSGGQAAAASSMAANIGGSIACSGGGGGIGSSIVGGGSSSLRSQRKTRKIEPVNRPGLVLKTPIAYKGNIDPSVIPIQKDGMGRSFFIY